MNPSLGCSVFSWTAVDGKAVIHVGALSAISFSTEASVLQP